MNNVKLEIKNNLLKFIFYIKNKKIIWIGYSKL